jgi:ferredoxin
VLFWLRGFRIVGSLPLDMPHSWISCFWPNTKRQIGFITQRCERIVTAFCNEVFEGKRYFRWSVWLTLPLDLAIAPICVPYLFIGRFYLAKTLFASHRCDSCQLCVKNCPVGAIVILHGRPFWKATCESCMRCMNICPKRAIQSWVTRILLLGYALMGLGTLLRPASLRLWFLLVSILFFPIYRLLHECWRIRAVNRAFTYTSLTNVWHRYLAPGTKLKDFRQRQFRKSIAGQKPTPNPPTGA